MTKSKMKNKSLSILIIFVAAILVTTIYFTYFANIITCKNLVRDRLVDPTSAQFSEIKYSKAGDLKGICGYYNARNRMGGYTGKQKFACYYNEKKVYFMSEENQYDDDMEKLVKDVENKFVSLICK